MSWVLDNLDLIGRLSVVHLMQSVLALLVGFAVSLPLGWVAWRFRLLRVPVVGGTGLLYTIPSLALLMMLPLALGFPATSPQNLVAALAIYAVAILVRSVVDGLDSVHPDTRGAAKASGYGPLRLFWGVELPLAGPVVLAGLRVAAVSTVSLATVGVLVGVTNLGYLFTNGLQRRIVAEVFAGIVAVVLIALVLDLVLVLIGRMLMPWLRAESSRSTDSSGGGA